MRKILLLLIAMLFIQCGSKSPDAVNVDPKNIKTVYSIAEAIKVANKGQYIYLCLKENESKVFPKDFEKIPKDKLVALTFDNCRFTTYPDYLSECYNLKTLEIVWYYDEESLPIKEIPEFVYGLTNLENLVLEQIKLSEINSDISDLTKLRSLKLYGCHLKEFPEAILNLENLENLNLACNDFTEIPSDITQLSKLKVLEFEGGGCGATPLESIPENIGELKNLEGLSLGHSKKPIKKLPSSFYTLKNLKVFECNGCGLEELPKDISNLSKLESISITNVNYFNEFPQSFFKLPNLKSFRFYASDVRSKELLLQKKQIDTFGSKLDDYNFEVNTQDENLFQFLSE